MSIGKDSSDAIERDAERAIAEYERRAKDPRLAAYYQRIDRPLRDANVARRRKVRAVLESLAPAPALRVLDVGCGDGADLADLADAGWNPDLLSGVEIFLPSLRVATSRLPRAKLVRANAAALPFPTGSFDAVIQTTLLSSILDPAVRKAVVDEMWRVTRVGGVLISNDMRSAGRNPHLVGIDRPELSVLFGRNGPFEVERITLSLRIASRVPSPVASALAFVPWLRTHYLVTQPR